MSKSNDKQYFISALQNVLNKQNGEDDTEGKREGKLLFPDVSHIRALMERDLSSEKYGEMMKYNVKYFKNNVVNGSHYKSDKKARMLIVEAVSLLEKLAA